MNIKKTLLQLGAVSVVALSVSVDAYAQNFQNVTDNILNASASIPGLVSTVAYIAGLGLGVLGVLKIKDHVENPSQTPLKDGAIRLGAGGALLALPFLYTVIQNNLSNGNTGTAAAADTVGAVGAGIVGAPI